MDYEAVTFTSANDQKLFGWFVAAENARATVIIHHGLLLNRSMYLAHVSAFHRVRVQNSADLELHCNQWFSDPVSCCILTEI